MPYYKNFNELELRGEFPVNPEGWEPLIIEYGYDYIGNAQYFYWRIKETRHTFKKAVSQLNAESEGDYPTQIQQFLEQFRQEMLGWIGEGISADWLREYTKEYTKFVHLY